MSVIEAENLPSSRVFTNIFGFRVELYHEEVVSVRILGEDCSCPVYRESAEATCVVRNFRYPAPFPSKESGLGPVAVVASLDVWRGPKVITVLAMANGLFIKIGLQWLISDEASEI